jgi:predicted  nucleic acid-binding Zn-ribbon protein
MHRLLGSAETKSRQHTHIQSLRSRAQELERKLEIGAYDSRIRQREAELRELRQRKTLMEKELHRVRRALGELAE